jgi:hypothetical protein
MTLRIRIPTAALVLALAAVQPAFSQSRPLGLACQLAYCNSVDFGRGCEIMVAKLQPFER